MRSRCTTIERQFSFWVTTIIDTSANHARNSGDATDNSFAIDFHFVTLIERGTTVTQSGVRYLCANWCGFEVSIQSDILTRLCDILTLLTRGRSNEFRLVHWQRLRGAFVEETAQNESLPDLMVFDYSVLQVSW